MGCKKGTVFIVIYGVNSTLADGRIKKESTFIEMRLIGSWDVTRGNLIERVEICGVQYMLDSLNCRLFRRRL